MKLEKVKDRPSATGRSSEQLETRETANKYEKYYQQAINDLQSNKRISLLRVIRSHCLLCTCFQVMEVEGCPIVACPLRPFRFGKYPEAMKRRGREQNFSKSPQ